jgi:anti-sigma factor RsiW
VTSTKDYVASLFEGYEATAALEDFKEELLGNLNAKVESEVGKGLTREEALAKAIAELGDVSALAEELSLQRKREVFEEVYLDRRRYMSAKRVAAYVGFSLLLLFGLIVAAIVYFGVLPGVGGFNYAAVFGSLMPFTVAAIGGFTFLGLTQETASLYPMKRRRAIWYTLAAVLIALGLTIMIITYFALGGHGNGGALMPAIAVLIPFVLPGGGLLAFLILTESSRLKPWIAERVQAVVKAQVFRTVEEETRFGLYSGTIWILAIVLFIFLGLTVGFRYSWLCFGVAVAAEPFLMAVMRGRKLSGGTGE